MIWWVLVGPGRSNNGRTECATPTMRVSASFPTPAPTGMHVPIVVLKATRQFTAHTFPARCRI